jgi:hypothetical protein
VAAVTVSGELAGGDTKAGEFLVYTVLGSGFFCSWFYNI